ncbi:fluoride efflux transporter CrcB [Thermotoga sp. KOL6]|uniref:fluoride efflux transporter CrcB n=1 Tax=Thermotoga sp. KOL6 TaxID=126741 RepID=UPI000C771C0A|nr:fluoride efflux transporter CrcB [Thermotoga sp. KOL6]PLV58045.1 chromosome condensation protein CrcB [Thermotoga sp. KOL6]
MEYIVVAVGGSLGAVLRYFLSKMINSLFPFTYIPLGTVVVNSIGSFILSFLMFSSIFRLVISEKIILFFGTGFLGAFTTFSTFTYETLSLIEEDPLRGINYVIINLFFGITCAYLGMILGRGKIS